MVLNKFGWKLNAKLQELRSCLFSHWLAHCVLKHHRGEFCKGSRMDVPGHHIENVVSLVCCIVCITPTSRLVAKPRTVTY